jgi:hypothetical protein
MDLLLQSMRLLLTYDLTRQQLARRLQPPVVERTAARLLKALEEYAHDLGCEFLKRSPQEIGRKGDVRVRYYRMRRLP